MAQNEVIYRCVNAACGRTFPRGVNFCPWCGTAQRAVAAPASTPLPVKGAGEMPVAAPVAAAAAAAAPPR
ncbi:hypothetical protein, partial [Massilia sp. DD77]|uniref:hypothetical protein n=1 Tax=Massilia sp. DD77 TaxID=3109349 RepID=UPI002FFDF591